MKVILLGYKDVDFTPSEKDAKAICGKKVFFANAEKDVVGMTIGSCWIDYKNLDMICFDIDELIGQEIDAEFNSKGKIVALSLLEAAA